MKTKGNVIIFIIVTLASGWIGVLVDSALPEQPEGNSLGMGLWLTMPFLISIPLRIVCRDYKDMGIKPHFKGNVKWYLSSLMIYPLVTVITVGFAMIFGCVDMSDFTITAFVSLAAFSGISGFAKNIFEEFAWRGYLTPKLMELKINDWLLYIISGLVWALWHVPYYLFFLPNQYFESLSRTGMIGTACLLMPCWAIMFAELYRLTKSVWPCVLMHAVEDAVPTVLVTTGSFMALTNHSDFWLNPTDGVITTILFTAIGLFLRSVRIKKERTA